MKKINKNFKKIFNLIYYILIPEFIMLCTNILPNLKICNKFRGKLLTPFMGECGKNFQIAKGVTINQRKKLKIGNNVYIAHNVWINGVGTLKIEDNVIISPNVVISTAKHKYIKGEISNMESENEPIVIGRGSWICSNSVITKGVKIGKGCIVGANSVVIKDIDNNKFFAGNPAKYIKNIN